MSRPARPIPIGIRVEHRLHLGLQIQVRDRLSDSVSDSRYAEHTNTPPAALLRYLDRPHRRRHIAPRGHPVPDLVEVVPKVRLKRLDRLLVNTRSTSIGPDLSPRSKTSRLEITNGLPSGFGSLAGSSRDITVGHRPSQD